MDECISEFEDAVRRHDGEWWAPTSEFSCPKEELVEELIERRHAVAYGDEYRRLGGLLVASTRFVPEVDFALATPYMSDGGGISVRPRSDAVDEAARERAYEMFEAHRGAGKVLCHRVGLEHPQRRPITPAPYPRSSEYAKERGGGAQWYFVAALMIVPVILWDRLKRSFRWRP